MGKPVLAAIAVALALSGSAASGSGGARFTGGYVGVSGGPSRANP